MSWVDLDAEVSELFDSLVAFDVRDRSLSYRNPRPYCRAFVSRERRAYKAEWARAKYRRDEGFRLRKVAADCARYHATKASAA